MQTPSLPFTAPTPNPHPRLSPADNGLLWSTLDLGASPEESALEFVLRFRSERARVIIRYAPTAPTTLAMRGVVSIRDSCQALPASAAPSQWAAGGPPHFLARAPATERGWIREWNKVGVNLSITPLCSHTCHTPVSPFAIRPLSLPSFGDKVAVREIGGGGDECSGCGEGVGWAKELPGKSGWEDVDGTLAQFLGGGRDDIPDADLVLVAPETLNLSGEKREEKTISVAWAASRDVCVTMSATFCPVGKLVEVGQSYLKNVHWKQ